MKAITTRSGVAYEGPSIPTNPSPKKPDVPKTLPKTTPIPEPNVPKSLPKSNIPYPSRLNQEKFREKASYQKEKIFQMFQDLRFDICFVDALFLMPRFAPTIRNLLMNKEKLLELAKILLNENCVAMLLKKASEKMLEILASFLFHAIFQEWMLSLPELTPTRMTLELADSNRLLTLKDSLRLVTLKWERFPFSTGLVVVDFEALSSSSHTWERSFLRTDRALIDVYGEEITLQVDNEAVTFNLDQTMRYSSTNDKSE
ncbi:hypothetical protein Tco_0273604 [Tanacetum coccineum]